MKELLFLLIGLITGFFIGVLKEHKRCKKIIIDKIMKADKFYSSFLLLIEWLKLYKNGIRTDSYLKWMGYSSIAIYGNGVVGKLLLNELKETDIRVRYIIDIKAEEMSGEIPIISLEENFPKVDAIIITIINEFDTIKDILSKKCDYDIIPIEDVVCGSSEY